jgi:hypothetical protein
MKTLLFAAIVYINGTSIEIPPGYVLDFKLVPWCEQHPDHVRCNPDNCIIYDNCQTEPEKPRPPYVHTPDPKNKGKPDPRR